MTFNYNFDRYMTSLSKELLFSVDVTTRLSGLSVSSCATILSPEAENSWVSVYLLEPCGSVRFNVIKFGSLKKIDRRDNCILKKSTQFYKNDSFF